MQGLDLRQGFLSIVEGVNKRREDFKLCLFLGQKPTALRSAS